MIDDYTFRPVFVEKIVSYARILRHFFMYEGVGQMEFLSKTGEESIFPGDVIGIDDKGNIFKINDFYGKYRLVDG